MMRFFKVSSELLNRCLLLFLLFPDLSFLDLIALLCLTPPHQLIFFLVTCHALSVNLNYEIILVFIINLLYDINLSFCYEIPSRLG